MIDLPITLTTASIFGLMFVWLSSKVISARVANDSLIGDDGHVDLIWAIRTHGNFVEYVPLFTIILGLLEVMGGNSIALIVMAAIFVVARILHVPGMSGPDANLKLRQAGIVGSFTALVAASLYGLYLALV